MQKKSGFSVLAKKIVKDLDSLPKITEYFTKTVKTKLLSSEMTVLFWPRSLFDQNNEIFCPRKHNYFNNNFV